MPKLVDHAVRFEFVRAAAFAIVRDRGVEALSRKEIAAALGTSPNTMGRLIATDAPLERLAALESTVRRRESYPRQLPAEPLARARALLLRLVPTTEVLRDCALVDLRLQLALDQWEGRADTEVRDRSQIAERGWSDSQVAEEAAYRAAQNDPSPVPVTDERPPDRRRVAVAAELERSAQDRRDTLVGAATLLGHDTSDARTAGVYAALEALARGLTLSVVLGELATDACDDEMSDHLDALLAWLG